MKVKIKENRVRGGKPPLSAKKYVRPGYARKSLTPRIRRQLTTKGKLPADDPDKHWEIERFGPIYLKWGTKYIRNEKGKIVGKEYRIHREKFHYIWVKWKVPFAGTEIYWSAEPQDNFTENREKIQKILEKKEIWPYPSKNDYLPNKDSQWKERLKQVEDAGYVLWRDPKRKQKWEMRDTKTLSLKWIHSIDGDSLPSSSDESEEEEEVKRETEIEDEV